MHETPEEFLDLMERIQKGDEQAAQELYELYGEHIFRVVRRRLSQPLRTRFDSGDFVQSVWTDFFAQVTKRKQFDNPRALVAFLSKMAFNKVIEAWRKNLQTARQDISRERSLEDTPSDGAAPRQNLASLDPTPSQEAVAREHWERLLEGQPVLVRHILNLLREGHTHEEIARTLNLSTKWIQRLLRRLDPGLVS